MYWKTMRSDRLVLGVDGGATKTVAWLARRNADDDPSVVGRGMAGPVNPQSSSLPQALANLDQVVDAAFDDAQVDAGPLAAAVLGLAGSDRDENRQAVLDWAKGRRLAHRVRVVHDALPVLAAGSPDGWGVALISGTGSFAFGQARDGQTSRAGGWGYLFGDEGSGYAIALAGLRAAAQSADGRAPATQILGSLLVRLGLEEPLELIPAVCQMADRSRIASFADVVARAADEGDPLACQILDNAAGDLAAMVAAVARKLGFADVVFPLALTGGMLLGSARLRIGLEDRIRSLGLRLEPVASVKDPVAGAVKLAQSDANERCDSV